MANTQKYLNHLLQSVGITPACSEEERAAAEEIASIFSNHGFEPEIQEFTSSSSPRLLRAVLCLLMFIGVVLMVVGGVVGAVGTLLVIICGVLFMLERFGRIRFPRIGSGGLSQNVIAYHKAAGPLASPRNRPVVVVAHYDSPRADFLAQMPFSPYRPILVKLLPFAMAIPVAVAVVRLLPIPEVAKLILWLVALIISLVPLVIGVSVLLNRYVLPYTSGAVCNKSSVAAMLGVMDAVSPFKGSKEFPEDVPFAAYMAEQRREFNDAFMEAAAAKGQAPIIERGESDGTTDEDVFAEEEPEEEFAYGLEAAEDEVADEEDDVVVPLTGVTVQMPAVQISEDDELVANDGAAAALESLDAEPAPIEDEDEADIEEEFDLEPEPAEEEELPVNDAGCIRYGLDAIRGLGMVAESTVIEYEPNAMPKPKPKAVLNFPIRKAAPKPEPAPEPKPEVAAPRAIADIPAPVVEAAPVAAAAAAAVASQVAPAVEEISEPEEAYEDDAAYEPDTMAAEAVVEDEYLEDEQELEPAEYDEDEYEAEDEQGADAYDDSYEMVDEDEDVEAAEEYLEDEDYEEDSWEDDIDIPMEAMFEAIEDDEEVSDEDEAESEVLPESDEYAEDDYAEDEYADEELVEAEAEAVFEDDGQDADLDEESDELDDYDDVQEAIFDEIDDEDGVVTDDEELTDEVAPIEDVDAVFEEDVADEDMLEEEASAETEEYAEVDEQVEDQPVEAAAEEPVSDDDDLTAFASIYQSALFTEPVAGYEDAFVPESEVAAAEPVVEDEFQGAVEADYEPESTAVMEHTPFEQQEDGSWAIGTSDDAEAIEPGATAVMSALVDPYEDEVPVAAYDEEIVEEDVETAAAELEPEFEAEVEVEAEPELDETFVEDEPSVEDEPLVYAPSDERIDAAYEAPSFDDVSFDESMFDVEPLADDLDIMEAIFEPVDDDESEGDIDEDEIIISDTEITVPEETPIDHTVEFAASDADAAEGAFEDFEPVAEGEAIAADDDVVEDSEVDEYVETEEAEPAYDEFDGEVVSATEDVVEDDAAVENADELPAEQEDEFIPEPEPVQHQVREIPNLPVVDQASTSQAEAPLTGETQLFDISAVIDSTMPVPGVEPRRVETVDSIMNEIEHDVPQRRQRSIKLPDISATTGAAPARSRSSLLDLPDPTPSTSGQLWTGGVTDTSARAKGGTMQFSVVSSDDAPKPSTGKFKTISAPTPRKAKKKRGLGGLFGRKKKRDENSMSEWLGVDEDYDAKSSGRNIGSWDKFEGDDSWKGGAASDGTLTEDELREAVASLGDDELLGHDIWFVATGASENGNAGIREFLDAHRDKLRGVFMINLECVGAGRLAMLTTEGERRVLKGDKRIMGLISRVSSDFHHEIGSVDMPFLDTDAHAAMEMSLRACTLAGVDGASLACSHSQEDISLNVDPANISLAADVVTEVIRRS